MTTDYRNDKETDNSPLWTEEPVPISLSGVSRFRRWLFPGLTASVVLVLIIVLGATSTRTADHLQSVEQSLYNLSDVIQSLNTSLQRAQSNTHLHVSMLTCSHANMLWLPETTEDVAQLQFTVENHKDQLTSVAEALKQLSALDSISRSVASLKCSLERLIRNSSAGDGCCPLGWDQFELSCYFFSSVSLSWNESRVWCDKQEAHLLILHSENTWDFVIRRTVPELFWVGLSDWRTGRWEWVNRTPYTMERRRWRPGQPDSWTGHGMGHGDEDCAHLHLDGRLNDLHCSTKMRYICQKHSLRV